MGADEDAWVVGCVCPEPEKRRRSNGSIAARPWPPLTAQFFGEDDCLADVDEVHRILKEVGASVLLPGSDRTIVASPESFVGLLPFVLR
ncbi:hypothetical protein ACLOJK_006956 [Asimina triloba]